MNFNVMPICLDALVKSFLYLVRTVFPLSSLFLRPHPPVLLLPPPHTSTHQLNGRLWSCTFCLHFLSRINRAKSVHVSDLRQTPGQVELKRASPHSSDVRLESKTGQPCFPPPHPPHSLALFCWRVSERRGRQEESSRAATHPAPIHLEIWNLFCIFIFLRTADTHRH